MFFPILITENTFSSIAPAKIYDILYYILPITYFSSFIYDAIVNKLKFKFDLFTIIILLFILGLIISIIFGIHIGFSSISNLVYLICILGYVYTLHIYKFEKENIKFLLLITISIFTFVSIVGIIQYIFNINLIKSGIYKYPPAKGRIYSTMITSTHLDKYLVINLLLTLYIEFKNEKKITILTIPILLGAIALALTFSRTGILCYYMLCLVFIILYIYKKHFYKLLIVLMTVGIIFVMPGHKYIINSTIEYVNVKSNSVLKTIHLDSLIKTNNRIFKFFMIKDKTDVEEPEENPSNSSTAKSNNNTPSNNNENNSSNNSSKTESNKPSKNPVVEEEKPTILDTDASIESREEFDLIADNLIKRFPITGVGIGNYLYIINHQNFSDYIDLKLDETIRYRYSHNMFKYLEVETGLLGLIPFICMLILILKSTFNKKHNILSILFIIISIAFYLFEPILFMHDFCPFYIIIMLLLTKNYECEEHS